MTSGCGRSPARPEAVDHVVIIAAVFYCLLQARQTTERTSVPLTLPNITSSISVEWSVYHLWEETRGIVSALDKNYPCMKAVMYPSYY